MNALKSPLRLLLFGLLGACLALGAYLYVHKSVASPEIAFYHWKTQFAPAESSRLLLQELQSRRIFVRFFDVSGGQKDYLDLFGPKATAIFTEKPLLPVVPVIYIHNADFYDDKGDIATLAKNIVVRTQKMLTLNKLTPARELHLDCDWNNSTQQRYFSLLTHIKGELPPDWTLSVTLRLHQIRDKTYTGVPPADRAALMLYNMGTLTRYHETNSIINPSVVASYMKGGAYPLPLDIALPLFSWGVLFDEGHNYLGLVRTVPENLDTDANWEPSGPSRYRVKQPCVVSGRSLKPGWEMRVERSTQQDIEASTRIVREALGPVRTVLLYHLDANTLAGWTADALRTLAAQLQ